MRRPRFALRSAFAALGLMAGIAPAQQSSQAPSPGNLSSASADPADAAASRPARYSLRNGMDYLAYREYDRALGFFRSIEGRQAELSPAEQLQLKKGIARAQEGKREAINGTRAVASNKGRSATQPGAFALVKPAAPANDGIQLTGAVMAAEPGPAPAPAPVAAPVAVVAVPSPAVEPTPIPTLEPEPIAVPAEVAPEPLPAPGSASDGPMPTVLPPATHLTPAPEISTDAVFGSRAPSPSPAPADGADLPALPAPAAAPSGEPAPSLLATQAQAPLEPTQAPSPAAEQPSTLDLPALPASPPESDPATSPAQATAPIPSEPAQAPLPQLPRLTESAPMVAQAAEPAASPGQAPQAVEPPPAPEASAMPASSADAGNALTARPVAPTNNPGSILNRRHREEIERIAQRGGSGAGGGGEPGSSQPYDPSANSAPSQGSTRLELIRAPSPTEARPLRRVPVPEEYVPLGPREWNPNRKYWAPAGTCHMILYFQDPVLERYGQGVEQSLGPIGRYFSYPLDDPRQSNQRNQILQPFYSMGKFCFQVGTLPYKLIVDPPWETEYDLGYYRPGDIIPADTIMITPTGVGPPLKGRKY